MESAKREKRDWPTFDRERVYSTREMAACFDMGQRKVRAWLDYFCDYIRPGVNEKGHWELDGAACERFLHVFQAMQEPGASMNEVRKRFCDPGVKELEKIVPIRQEVSYQVLQESLQLIKALQVKVSTLESYQQELFEKYNETIRQQKETAEENSFLRSEMKELQRSLEEVHNKMIRNFKEIHLSLQVNEISRREKKKRKGFLFG